MLRVSSVEHRGFGAGALKQTPLYRLTVFLSNIGLQVLLSGTPVTVGTVYWGGGGVPCLISNKTINANVPCHLYGYVTCRALRCSHVPCRI